MRPRHPVVVKIRPVKNATTELTVYVNGSPCVKYEYTSATIKLIVQDIDSWIAFESR